MKVFQIPVGMVCPTKGYGDIVILNDEQEKAYALALTTTPNALKGQVVRLETKGLEPYRYIQPSDGFMAAMFHNPGTKPKLKSAQERFLFSSTGEAIVFINPETQTLEEGFFQRAVGDELTIWFPKRPPFRAELHYFFHLRSDLTTNDLAMEKHNPKNIGGVGSIYKWGDKEGVVLSNDKRLLVVHELKTNTIWNLEVRA